MRRAEEMRSMDMETTFDTIVIGGSYAGLSAAMALGRSRRRVLVIDSGLPCNRQTPRSHNFLTHDGTPPGEIATRAKHQIAQYPTITFYNGLAVSSKKTSYGFELKTEDEKSFSGKKLIFATGIRDNLPSIKGFAECWGISAIHCPYCHGYEFRDAKTGIIANGDKAFHLASLVNNLTDKLTILTTGKANFSTEQTTKLERHGIAILEQEIAAIKHDNGYLKRVIFADGTKTNFTALYAAVSFTQHCEIPEALGCELTAQGYIKIDDMHKTTVEGVFACGDNTAALRSVANAVSAGNLTGAVVNMELTKESF